MYYANCEWYVGMGKHYKPLCERNSLRPAKCSECPVYIRSIEDENTKLRELVQNLKRHVCKLHRDEPCAVVCDAYDSGLGRCVYEAKMRELGIEVDG